MIMSRLLDFCDVRKVQGEAAQVPASCGAAIAKMCWGRIRGHLAEVRGSQRGRLGGISRNSRRFERGLAKPDGNPRDSEFMQGACYHFNVLFFS